MKCVTSWSPRSCSLWQSDRNHGPRRGTHKPGLFAIGVLEAAPVKPQGDFPALLPSEVPSVATLFPFLSLHPLILIVFSELEGSLRAIDATCSLESGVLLQPASGVVRSITATHKLLLPLYRERGGPHHFSGHLQSCRLMILNTFTAAFTTRVEELGEMEGGNQESSDPWNGQHLLPSWVLEPLALHLRLPKKYALSRSGRG